MSVSFYALYTIFKHPVQAKVFLIKVSFVHRNKIEKYEKIHIYDL